MIRKIDLAGYVRNLPAVELFLAIIDSKYHPLATHKKPLRLKTFFVNAAFRILLANFYFVYNGYTMVS